METNKRFCCSCTPRDSTFAISILLTVFSTISFLGMLKMSVRLFCVTSLHQFFEENHVSYADMIPVSISVFQAITVILLIISLIQASVNIALIVGVIKEKAHLISIWLIVYKILIILVSISFVLLSVLCFTRMSNILIGVCTLVFGILHACAGFYFVSVVSYHRNSMSTNEFKTFANDFDIPRESNTSFKIPI